VPDRLRRIVKAKGGSIKTVHWDQYSSWHYGIK
jgi:hypothetical protein